MLSTYLVAGNLYFLTCFLLLWIVWVVCVFCILIAYQMHGLHMFFPLCTLSSHFAGGFCVQWCPLACLFWIIPLLSVWIHSSADRSHASALAACVFRDLFKEFHVQVLCLSLWFLLNLYKCVRYWSSFILSFIFIQWSQFSLLQTLSFLHWLFLAPLSDLSRVIMLGLIPGFPLLFHWSIFLSLHRCHKLLMAIGL